MKRIARTIIVVGLATAAAACSQGDQATNAVGNAEIDANEVGALNEITPVPLDNVVDQAPPAGTAETPEPQTSPPAAIKIAPVPPVQPAAKPKAAPKPAADPQAGHDMSNMSGHDMSNMSH